MSPSDVTPVTSENSTSGATIICSSAMKTRPTTAKTPPTRKSSTSRVPPPSSPSSQPTTMPAAIAIRIFCVNLIVRSCPHRPRGPAPRDGSRRRPAGQAAPVPRRKAVSGTVLRPAEKWCLTPFSGRRPEPGDGHRTRRAYWLIYASSNPAAPRPPPTDNKRKHRMHRTILILAGLGLAQAALAEPRDYAIDMARSRIFFDIDHRGYSTMLGRFAEFGGTFKYDAENPANSSLD